MTSIEQYTHCAEIGRYGGLSKSEKKVAAARRNIARARAARKPRPAIKPKSDFKYI